MNNQQITRAVNEINTKGDCSFGILNEFRTFIMLYDLAYDEKDGNMYYYDPRDDDIWPLNRFIREIHGKDGSWTDHLYLMSSKGQVLFTEYMNLA